MLKPVYKFNSNGKSVLLRRGMFEISSEKFDASIGLPKNYFSSEVRLDFLPHPRILIYYPPKNYDPSADLLKNIETPESFSDTINGFEVFPINIQPTINEHGFNVSMKLLPTQHFVNGIGNDNTVLEYAIFHIFNFPFVNGTRFTSIDDEKGIHNIPIVDLSNDKWDIQICSQIETLSNIKSLSEEGGYQLTHVGKIKNKNGSSFTGKELTELLNTLDFFLSFARGGWCLPVCTVGYNNIDKQIWEMWSAPKGNWKTPCGWFNGNSGEQLSALFPSFMKIWQQGDWSAVLTEVIYWYLQANNNENLGIDAGIILTQTALETLSYNYLVKHIKIKTESEFKNSKYKAFQKFRDLFQELNIPTGIPNECTKMQAFSKPNGSQWRDSPEALTQIRNFLVHPQKGNRDKYNDIYFEAWKLGLWYLDLAILAICEYEGGYGNRLNKRYAGDSDTVPY